MLGVKRKSSGDAAGSAKKCQAITMETKVDIMIRVERGELTADVAHSYQMNRSTIRTILKNKDKIMEHVKSSVTIKSTIISKKRGKVIEELEKLLSIWMEDCHQKSKLLKTYRTPYYGHMNKRTYEQPTGTEPLTFSPQYFVTMLYDL
ncbi:putative CENPB DNA-binding domain-containing protein 1 [Penaeus vannamei]|uniref:putative CENPB DNA-binding domain-containing protein 1 n=1 Tax=Penaeus vannamei TaxID=6689 RepID=UPI00387F9B6F